MCSALVFCFVFVFSFKVLAFKAYRGSQLDLSISSPTVKELCALQLYYKQGIICTRAHH